MTTTFHPDNRRADALSDGRLSRLDAMELPKIVAARGVYVPQQDSRLLIVTLGRAIPVQRRRTVDLCTGSGVVAIAAATLGASPVSAWDISAQSVECARDNAAVAGVPVDVHRGSWVEAIADGPFDLVLSNPPYVPTPCGGSGEDIPAEAGPARAFDAGPDGRLVLDELCASAPALLADGGTMLFVQSEFAGIGQSLSALRSVGVEAEVVGRQTIPFGPVLTARARWLETSGRLAHGRREETLVVIRADKSPNGPAGT